MLRDSRFNVYDHEFRATSKSNCYEDGNVDAGYFIEPNSPLYDESRCGSTYSAGGVEGAACRVGTNPEGTAFAHTDACKAVCLAQETCTAVTIDPWACSFREGTAVVDHLSDASTTCYRKLHSGTAYNRIGTISLVAESQTNNGAALAFTTNHPSGGSRPEAMRIEGDGDVVIGGVGPASLHANGCTGVCGDGTRTLEIGGTNHVAGIRLESLASHASSSYEIWGDNDSLHFDTMNTGRDFTFNSGKHEYGRVEQGTGNARFAGEEGSLDRL